MGGFYGSVQVRTTDRNAVKAATESVATVRKIRCLVGPEINGWVGVYPEGSGQDESVGQAIAQQVQADVLQLMVHDDDVLAYWLWRDQKLVDSYWSKPGYFGEDNRAEEESRSGEPEMFRPIIGDKAHQLTALLDRKTSSVFEYERLEKFAKVLGISNAVSAYEYLKDGERDAIKGWRKFEEFPGEAVKSLAQQKRAERNRVKSERIAMSKSGLLIFSKAEKEHGVRCGSAKDGFVSAWADYRGGIYIEECPRPFTVVSPSSLESPAHVTAVVSNRDATRIAFAAGDRVRVWDSLPVGWRHLIDVPEKDLTIGAVMSEDGTLIVHQSRQEIVVTQIPGGRHILSIPLAEDYQLGSFDPTGRWVILGGSKMMLLDLNELPHERVIYIGGRRGGPSTAAAQRALNIDVDVWEKQQNEAMESFLNQMKAAAAKSKQVPMSVEQIQNMREQARLAMERIKTELLAMKSGQTPGSVRRRMQANERVHAAQVSSDGKWFSVGTSEGLRVYEWKYFPKENESDSPPPVWQFSAPCGDDPNSSAARVYAIAEEPGGRAIVFGGINGTLYRMDLSDGQVRPLILIPTRGWITSITVSRDGEAIAIQSVVQKMRRTESLLPPGTTWEVWSYPRVRDASVSI
jgi:hypothetical protein